MQSQNEKWVSVKDQKAQNVKKNNLYFFFFLETTLLFLKANLYVKFKDTKTKMIIAFVNN